MYYVLTVMAFLANAEPTIVSKTFTDRQECQKTEGALLTMLDGSDKVLGWLPVNECIAVHETTKAALQ